MSDITKQLSQTLQTDRGSQTQFNVQGVYQNPTVRPQGFGDAVQSLTDAFAVYAQHNKAEKRKQETSDTLTGELLQKAGKELPVDASDTTIKSYNHTTMIQDASISTNAFITAIETDEFHNMSVDKQDEYIQKQRDILIDYLGQKDLEDNDVSKAFISKTLDTLNNSVIESRFKYNNYTVPSKNISDQFDLLVHGGTDVETASAVLDSMKSKEVRGLMDDTSFNSLIYGNVLRALEADNTAIYEAFRGTDTYSNLTPTQQRTVDNTYGNTVDRLYKESIDNTVNTFRGRYAQFVATGDMGIIEEVDNDIRQLPADMVGIVLDKVQKSRDKAMSIYSTVTKYNTIKSDINNETGVSLSDSETVDLLEYKMKEINNSAVNADGKPMLSPLQVGHMATTELAQNGIFTEESQKFFELSTDSISFPNGGLDSRSTDIIQSATKMRSLGVSQYNMQKIMGDASYNMFDKIRRRVERGESIDLATTQVINNQKNFDELPEPIKTTKILANIDAINTSGILENVVDTITDYTQLDVIGDVLSMTGDILGGILSDVPLAEQDTGYLEGDISTELDLYTDAPISYDTLFSGASYGDALSGDVWNKLRENNASKASLFVADLQQTYPELDEKTLTERAEELMKEESLIINSNIVPNRALHNEFKTALGEQASKYTSMAVQSLLPLMGATDEMRTHMQDTVIEVRVRNDKGTWDIVEDKAQRSQLMLRADSDKENIKVSVNLDKYADVYAPAPKKKVILPSGQKYGGLRKNLRDLAGGWDTRLGLGAFTQHTVDYDDTLGSFVVRGLDRDGDALTTDKPLLVGDKVVLKADSELMTILPKRLVLAFASAYKARAIQQYYKEQSEEKLPVYGYKKATGDGTI